MSTANNFALRGSALPLLFFFFSPFFLLRLEAQKISKYYTTVSQKSGNLYFIEPKYGFTNKKDKCDLTFDMTYLSSDDSLILNFSLISPEIMEVDSVAFLQNEKSISSRTQKIFIEDAKKSWEHRYTSHFAIKDIRNTFQQENSPRMAVYSDQNILIMSMKQNHWKKERDIVSKIIRMIQVN